MLVSWPSACEVPPLACDCAILIRGPWLLWGISPLLIYFINRVLALWLPKRGFLGIFRAKCIKVFTLISRKYIPASRNSENLTADLKDL